MKKLGSSTFMLEYLVPVRHYCVCAALFYNQGIICTKGSLSINLNSGVQQDRQQLYRCLCNTTKNRQFGYLTSHLIFLKVTHTIWTSITVHWGSCSTSPLTTSETPTLRATMVSIPGSLRLECWIGSLASGI